MYTAAGETHTAKAYSVRVQLADGPVFEITALALSLPPGIGMLLGDTWIKSQRAELKWLDDDAATCTVNGPDMQRPHI